MVIGRHTSGGWEHVIPVTRTSRVGLRQKRVRFDGMNSSFGSSREERLTELNSIRKLNKNGLPTQEFGRMMTRRRTAAVPVSGFAFVRCLKHLLEFPVRHDGFGNVTACVDDRNRSSRFIGPAWVRRRTSHYRIEPPAKFWGLSPV